MEQLTIKAVEMTRNIRDKQANELQDKTPAEIIAFYQQNAQQLHSKLNLPVLPQHSTEELKSRA